MTELILGDNQFLGVNTQIGRKLGRQKSLLPSFGDKSQIFSFLSECAKILAFLPLCLPRMKKILRCMAVISGKSKQFEHYSLYPCLPYAHKYHSRFRNRKWSAKNALPNSHTPIFSRLCVME